MLKLPLPIACLLFAAAACGKVAAPGEQAAPVPVEVVQVASSSGRDAIIGTGSIAYERERVLSFRSGGVIRELTVDEGDAVKAGRIIAALDATPIAARLAQAQADMQKAKRDLERDQALAGDGWVSQQRLADRQTSARQAEAAYESARYDMRWVSLVAPSSGSVLERHVQAGEVVAAGQPVVTLSDETSPLVVRLPLADRAVARVRLGQSASVTVSALPDRAMTGTVSRIGDKADPRTGAVDVEIRLPRAAQLKTGYIAEVRIDAPRNDAGTDALQRIPAEAILEAEGATAHVFTIAGGDKPVARRAQVRFAGFDGDDALVSGLAPDALVITRGGGYAKDGKAVVFAAARRQ